MEANEGAIPREEQHERLLPSVHTLVLSGPHQTEEDAKSIAEPLKTSDIFLMEMFAWNQAQLEVFKNISSGKTTPEQAITELDINNWQYPEFATGLVNELYNSKKQFAFLDIPEDKVAELGVEPTPYAYPTNFEEELVYLRNSMTGSAEEANSREKYLVEQYPQTIKQLLEQDPDLANKTDISVLMFWGGVHTGMYHRLRKMNYDVTRAFPQRQITYPLEEEVFRRIQFKKEVSNDLLASVYLSRQVYANFWEEIYKDKPLQESTDLSRKIVSQFDFNEIKQMYNQSKEVDEKGSPKTNWKSVIETHLETKKTKLPQPTQLAA